MRAIKDLILVVYEEEADTFYCKFLLERQTLQDVIIGKARLKVAEAFCMQIYAQIDEITSFDSPPEGEGWESASPSFPFLPPLPLILYGQPRPIKS